MRQIHDNGQNDPLEYVLTDAEREAAAFAQAQLRLDAIKRNAEDAKRVNSHE